MKLAVTGSRTFCDYAWLEQCLLRSFRVQDIEAVVSGGARGADALAARFARRHSIPLVEIKADWERHGRKAGPMRNSEIIREADVLAAFWDGSSAGTRDTLAKARRAGLNVVVYPCSPGPLEGISQSEAELSGASSPRSASSGRVSRRTAFSRGESVMPLLFPELESWGRASAGSEGVSADTGSSSESTSKKG
jgi:hypothetical protein